MGCILCAVPWSKSTARKTTVCITGCRAIVGEPNSTNAQPTAQACAPVDHGWFSQALALHYTQHTQVSPGGSVANTLVAVARLSTALIGPPVRVSMAGSVGEDALGCYFNAQVGQRGWFARLVCDCCLCPWQAVCECFLLLC